jgi:hypothetical protein
MEPDQIIERIDADDSTLTVEELSAAKTELESAQSALKDQIKGWGGGTFEDLSALKADYDAVTNGLSKVVEALGAAQAQVQAIIDEVAGGEDATATEDAEVEPVIEAEVTPVAASVRATLARVRTRTEPTPEVTDTTDLRTVRSSFVLNGRDTERPSSAQLGSAFADAARRFGGTKTVVASIKTELAPERTLSGDASANERKMLDLFGSNPVVPVTASGGCCSIPEPIYDQPLIGSLERPIRAAFDVLNASRGAVQAYPPVCLPDEGADVWTCAQDEAVTDDPDTWKSCTAIECEESEPTLVEPIYKCLTIGTFQQKFAPEQWEAFLFQTDKLAARLAEARLFNWLVQSATSNYESAFETGSTFANFIKQQIRIAAAIRQDQRLGDAQLITVGSNLIYSSIAEDTLTRRLADTEEVLFFKDRVDATLREFGITYVGSDDVATMDPFSYDGTIPGYPDEIPMVTLPAGSAKVLDGGEKNLGVDVPDLDTARRNEVAAFSEFWEGLLVRNCNVVYSTVEVESCDTIPCPS